jgi:hypothetical protein
VTKIPIIGQHYVKEVPPSDNVGLYSLWLWLWWFGVGDVERREGGEEMEGGGSGLGVLLCKRTWTGISRLLA